MNDKQQPITDDLPMTTDNRQPKVYQRFGKRSMDCILSLMAIIVLLRKGSAKRC
jgi:hypothetical protein